GARRQVGSIKADTRRIDDASARPDLPHCRSPVPAVPLATPPSSVERSQSRSAQLQVGPRSPSRGFLEPRSAHWPSRPGAPPNRRLEHLLAPSLRRMPPLPTLQAARKSTG